MIDDLELRTLFQAESEEHLQTLENGLLRLEAEPGDARVLEELFRSAHSLKGAARMLSVEDLETLAHQFEEELGAARRGHRALSSTDADRLYGGLDAMRRLAQEACGGEPAQVDIPSVLAQLRGEGAPVAHEIVAGPSLPIAREAPDVRGAAIEPVVIAPPAPPEDLSEPWSPSAFKIETIRVEPHKLDALMTLAGEMAVTTTRVVRALAVMDDLIALSEEWGRDAIASRDGPTAVTADASHPETQGQSKQLGRFLERQTGRLERLEQLVSKVVRAGDEEVSRLGSVAGSIVEAIRGIRLLPVSTIFNLFPRLVRDLSREQEKEVRLVVEGGTITADKHLLEEMKDPLMHLIRNAVDHAVEPPDERTRLGKPREATIWLRAFRTTTKVAIEIADDGRGLDEEAICRTAVRNRLRSEDEIGSMSHEEVQRLIFTPGFSTSALITDMSGRGVGLDVVRTNIERLNGTIAVNSVPGVGCTFRLEAPVTLETTRVLLVRVGPRSYALPLESVQETSLVSSSSIFSVEGRPSVRWEGRPVPVAPLSELLELPQERVHKAHHGRESAEGVLRPSVLLAMGSERIALLVDGLLDEQEVVLKPFGGLLVRVRNVLGSTILSTGEICMVLNPQDLIKSMQKPVGVQVEGGPSNEPERKKLLLLAEDSITTRTQEKRILEGAGYEVVTAVDGSDAFSKLGGRSFDAVISDIEMPNMNGLQLAERIRKDPKYKELPIILVTSLASDADRRRGIEVGANAYITKSGFDQKLLLETIRKLV